VGVVLGTSQVFNFTLNAAMTTQCLLEVRFTPTTVECYQDTVKCGATQTPSPNLPGSGHIFVMTEIAGIPSASGARWISTGGFGNVTALNRAPQGDTGEALVLDYALSSGELAQVEGYAEWHWANQAALPGGHTYAGAAPTTGPASYPGAGAFTGSGALAGIAKAKRPMAGSVAGVGSLVGAFGKVGGSLSMTGAISGSGVIIGAAKARRPLVGPLAGSGAATAAMFGRYALRGSLAGVGGVAGSFGYSGTWQRVPPVAETWAQVAAGPLIWTTTPANPEAWS
jgi:hypothetical protein